MRKKKHNADEIRFCQSRRHKRLYEFTNGETTYLVNVTWEDGRPIPMVVCKDCYKNKVGDLVREITIDNPRVPVVA
jgi:hypothetical protein